MSNPQIDWSTLYNLANEARNLAYAPYSNYKVGAALLTSQGTIYTGCNIENASFTPTVCAERVAVFKAISEGVTDFVAIAVVTATQGAPCGVCRQVMNEFCPNIPVLIGNTQRQYKIVDLSELLPYGFGPTDILS